MQPARAPDQPVTRLQIEVVGIAEDDLGAEVRHIAVGQRLDGTARADRHEGGGLDDAVRRAQLPPARRAVPGSDGEVKRVHFG